MVDKKGAINLSINMIIVLILAIIILGFALNFVTKMFRQGEVALTGNFPEVKIPVSRDKPIGIGDTFLVREGETRKVSLKIMNTDNDPLSTGERGITCGTNPAPEINNIEVVEIPAGETETVKAVIVGTTDMQNNDICIIRMGLCGEDTGCVSHSFFLETD